MQALREVEADHRFRLCVRLGIRQGVDERLRDTFLQALHALPWQARQVCRSEPRQPKGKAGHALPTFGMVKLWSHDISVMVANGYR